MLKKNVRGEITVFLSLSLTCICALMCGLLESARVAGSGWYLQTALNSSLDSLMSKYHRRVWEEYHLLLLEYEEEGLEKELEPYIESYLDTDSSYHLTDVKLQVLPPAAVTDREGIYLEQEILDYMKLGIWNVEKDVKNIESLSADIREAESLGELTGKYQADTRQALKLEQSIENIGASLAKQEQYVESGKRRLGRCDGNGFIADSNKLLKELDKMPDLVNRYEEEADKLADNLKRTKDLPQGNMEDLKKETQDLLSAEIDSFYEYTDKEGERRRQIRGLIQQTTVNRSIVESAVREAEDTQEYIDEWYERQEDEDDDGDDGDDGGDGDDGDDEEELDEEELWDDVLDTFERFQVNHDYKKPEIKDKKTMNLLERISRLAGGDLLSMVIPSDKEISVSTVNTSSYPSQAAAAGGDNTEVSGENAVEGMLNTALINEYTVYHFTNFLSEQEKEFQYEQEYILNGFPSDRENLKETVNRILKLRGALNLVHLLKDSEKRGEAQALAAAITGAAGIAPLSKIVTFFILTVWAFGESLEDVKCLFDRGKIPFIKSSGEWKLTLTELLKLEDGNHHTEGGSGNDRGLDYQSYLRFFFLMQKKEERNYRIMDMIQKNIGQRQNGFLMSKCAVRIELECDARGKFAVLRKKSSASY